MRSTTILDLPNFFFARGKDGSLQLKHDHTYYYQCQLMMVLHCCKTIIPLAEKFFELSVLPELLGDGSPEARAVKYPVMLLMNLKRKRIMEHGATVNSQNMK